MREATFYSMNINTYFISSLNFSFSEKPHHLNKWNNWGKKCSTRFALGQLPGRSFLSSTEARVMWKRQPLRSKRILPCERTSLKERKYWIQTSFAFISSPTSSHHSSLSFRFLLENGYNYTKPLHPKYAPLGTHFFRAVPLILRFHVDSLNFNHRKITKIPERSHIISKTNSEFRIFILKRYLTTLDIFSNITVWPENTYSIGLVSQY